MVPGRSFRNRNPERGLNRILALFSSPVGALLLFCAGALLFTWPLLSIYGDQGGTPLFAYIFITWTALVILLLLKGQAIRRANDPDRKR